MSLSWQPRTQRIRINCMSGNSLQIVSYFLQTVSIIYKSKVGLQRWYHAKHQRVNLEHDVCGHLLGVQKQRQCTNAVPVAGKTRQTTFERTRRRRAEAVSSGANVRVQRVIKCFPSVEYWVHCDEKGREGWWKWSATRVSFNFFLLVQGK